MHLLAIQGHDANSGRAVNAISAHSVCVSTGNKCAEFQKLGITNGLREDRFDTSNFASLCTLSGAQFPPLICESVHAPVACHAGSATGIYRRLDNAFICGVILTEKINRLVSKYVEHIKCLNRGLRRIADDFLTYLKTSIKERDIERKLCQSETKRSGDCRDPIRETENPPIFALAIREITAYQSIKKSLFRNSAFWFAEDALNVCCLGNGDSSWV
ncbi:hypothetical protein CEXT_348991 [Caerostris extrusa]|uniref:Uncharacterized protein n=1 Tax=Caerostris extrusa TaxID=172846 RepID=A0AAV4QGF1_CAEEX|nr:hypothetical protein CEXT_348991 [Caerostris extrusa]